MYLMDISNVLTDISREWAICGLRFKQVQEKKIPLKACIDEFWEHQKKLNELHAKLKNLLDPSKQFFDDASIKQTNQSVSS